MSELYNFVAESNRIEGIMREPTIAELDATERFIGLPALTMVNLKNLVAVYQPGAVLRDKVGFDVRVGSYYPPRGGPAVYAAVKKLLGEINAGDYTPYTAHQAYEHLHPFTDGNGRSGRAIWLWQMKGRAPLGFLHQFYYQTLSGERNG